MRKSKFLRSLVLMVLVAMFLVAAAATVSAKSSTPDRYILIYNRCIDFDYWLSLTDSERQTLVLNILLDVNDEDGDLIPPPAYWKLDPRDPMQDLRAGLASVGEGEEEQLRENAAVFYNDAQPQGNLAITAVRALGIDTLEVFFSREPEEGEEIDEAYFDVKVGSETVPFEFTRMGRKATLSLDLEELAGKTGALTVKGKAAGVRSVLTAVGFKDALEDGSIRYIVLAPRALLYGLSEGTTGVQGRKFIASVGDGAAVMFNPAQDLSNITLGNAVTLELAAGTVYNEAQFRFYPTIQAAVNAADEGGTIEVTAGTYREQIVIDKPLTLFGPNAENAGYGVRNAEADIKCPSELEFSEDSLYYLFSIVADDVTVSGFRFDDEGKIGWTAPLITGVHAHGDRVQITNNMLEGFDRIQIHVTNSTWDGAGWNYDRNLTDILVEGNYLKNSFSPLNALYMQGAAGSVKNNKLENGNGIQIQPYANPGDGIVEGNQINSFAYGVYYNVAKKGAGEWIIKDNIITAADVPSNLADYGYVTWRGLVVHTFGSDGTGSAPTVTFSHNAIDGMGARPALKPVGIVMFPGIANDATAVFSDNTFTNVEIGAERQSGSLNLENVLGENNFPAGSTVIGNQIMVPEGDIIYNQETGETYNTIQTAVNEANDGDTILVGAGEYDVTYFEAGKFKHYLWINKPVTLCAADMENKPVLKATYGGSSANHQQATVHITADNVTLDGLEIYSIDDYPTDFTKVVEITGANYATITNCCIYDEGRTAIYVSDPRVGQYTITDNYLDGAIVPANGAGNGLDGDKAIISGNTINASISFTGKTNSGWDPNSYDQYPTIIGNELNGTEYGMFINSRDENPDKLITDAMLDEILANNRFPMGADVQIVQDSYEYYGAVLHRKRLLDSPPVHNETQGTYYLSIQAAIDAAEAGDTVSVAAGEYAEDILISKPITLLGANADVPCGSGRGAESWIQPATNAATPIKLAGFGISDQVTINGFEITGELSNYGIYCGADGAANLDIRFNSIHNIGTARGSGNVYAINYRVNEPSPSDINISDNCICSVSNDNAAALGNSAAIWVGQSTANGTVSNLTIERNEISNIFSGRSDKDASGIYLGAAWGAGTGAIDGPVVCDNKISGIKGGLAYGIQLSGKTPGALIANNELSDISGLDSAPEYGFGVAVPVTNTGAATVCINDNSLTGMPYGVVNGTADCVDATHNWWGHAMGPSHELLNPRGQGSAVSENVKFSPFWTNEGMTEEYRVMEVSSEVPEFRPGESAEFTVNTVANNDAGVMVRAHFTIPEGVVVEYMEQNEGHPDYGKWFELKDLYGPGGGFPVADVTGSLFRATFEDSGTYNVKVEFKTVEDATVLAGHVIDAVVVEPMTLSSALPDKFRLNEKAEFTVSTVANGDAGKLVRAYFTLPEEAGIEYYEVQDEKWYPLADVYGPATGFPVADATSKFRASFSAVGDFTVFVEFKAGDGGIVLASHEIKAQVYDPSIAAAGDAAELMAALADPEVTTINLAAGSYDLGADAVTVAGEEKTLQAEAAATVVFAFDQDISKITLGDNVTQTGKGGLTAQDFSVGEWSGVRGYNVGFKLEDGATASEVKSAVVTLYDADNNVLQMNTARVASFGSAVEMSSPFDVFGNFDYDADGYWETEGWQGEKITVPAKAEVVVCFNNGYRVTAVNAGLEGDPAAIVPPVHNDTTDAYYDTIQAAINAAEAGNTIRAAAATFEEAVTVNKPVSLLGANAGIDPNKGERGAETVLKGRLTMRGANSITLDGFKFLNETLGSNNQIAVAVNGSGPFTVVNSIFERDTGAVGGDLAGEKNLTLRGIEISAASSGSLEIKNNLFTGADTSIWSNSSWSSAVYLNGSAMQVAIQDNVFDVSRTALNLDDFSEAVTVEGNDFQGIATHIAFGGTAPTGGSHAISGNNFGLADAVFNLSNVAVDFRLDATDNTYGGKAPGEMSLDELFALEDMLYHKGKSSRKGFARILPGNVYVTTDGGTINQAIEAAEAGDTVNVAGGEYDENLIINKKLGLVGTGRENTVLNGGIRLSTSEIAVSGFAVSGGAQLAGGNSGAGICIDGATSGHMITANSLVGPVAGPQRAGILFGYNTAGITVKGNTLTGWYQGIYINPSAHLTIDGNRIENNYVGIGSDGLNDVEIISNKFIDNEVEAWGSSAVGENVRAHDNSFTGNPVAVAQYSGNIIDAARNWWGTAEADEIEALVLGEVEYSPWYTEKAMENLANLSVQNSDSGRYYLTIQAAVNAAAEGDTIVVAEGVYDGFSVEGKDELTIEGAGEDKTIIAPKSLILTATDHKYTANMKASVFVNKSSGVLLKGMTIGDSGLSPDAIVFWNASSGEISGCSIEGESAFTGMQTGQGLAVDAGAGEMSTLKVAESTFSNWNKNAIDVVDGNGAEMGGGDISLELDKVRITGRGFTSINCQNGLLLWSRAGGKITGEVSNSSFADLLYDGDDACAVLVYGDAELGTIRSTTFKDTDLFIANYGSGSIDATLDNDFDGLEDNFAIEDRIYHKLDDAACGLVTWAAENVYVTEESGSIQRGIDAAGTEWTVNVAAGLYDERLTINKQGLQLRGAQYGNDARERTGVEESIISGNFPKVQEQAGIWINADDVKIDGFTIEPHEEFWGMIYPYGTADVTISNNIIKRNIYGGRCSGLRIEKNWFISPYAGSQKSAFLSLGLEESLQILDNKFTDIEYSAIILECSLGKTTDTLIKGNTICRTNSQAINIAGDHDNLIISNNHIEKANLDKGADKGAIRLYADALTGAIEITSNALVDSFNGIAIKNGENVNDKDIRISGNILTGNSNAAVYHGGVGLLNLSADNEIDGVGISAATKTQLFEIEDKIYHALDNAAKGLVLFKAGNAYVTEESGSIQRGIDAAGADWTVNVAAGSYSENLIVNKKLKLVGEGREYTVLNGGIRLSASDVAVSGFAVNGGAQLAGGNSGAGICIDGATSGHVITANSLAGPVAGPQRAGILFGYNTEGITVEGNILTGWFQGIYINPSAHLTVDGNRIEDNYVGIGSDGLSDVEVMNNEFVNNEVEGWGCSAVGEGVRAHGNSFTGNPVAVAQYSGNAIDAAGNWWGSADPEEIARLVSGNVEFNPWYMSAEMVLLSDRDAVNKVNAAGEEEMRAVLQSNSAALKLGIGEGSAYAKLSSLSKEWVGIAVYGAKPEGGYDDATAVRAAFDLAVSQQAILNDVNRAANAGAMLEALLDNAEDLGIDVSGLGVWTGYYQAKVAGYVLGDRPVIGYSTVGQIKGAYSAILAYEEDGVIGVSVEDEANAVVAVNGAGDEAALRTVLLGSSVTLGLDMDGFNDLTPSGKNQVVAYMFDGLPYEKAVDIMSHFNDFVGAF